MNIGIILPSTMREQVQGTKSIFKALIQPAKTFFLSRFSFEVKEIELIEGLNILVCFVPVRQRMKFNDRTKKKIRSKFDKVFYEKNAWPVLEHRDLIGLYNGDKYHFSEVLSDVAAVRFLEILKLIHGMGDLSVREITITGKSDYLEYAISSLISKVKLLNILLPEGGRIPIEADEAFAQTGIPVHITTDTEVLKRSAMWIRFPDDHESFDVLPEEYVGMIADFGNMKIIDTKNKKIFSIRVEFSEIIKSRLGDAILNSFGEGVLESVVITICASTWNSTFSEASLRLGTVLFFNLDI